MTRPGRHIARLKETRKEIRRERDIARPEVRPNEARVRYREARRDLPSPERATARPNESRARSCEIQRDQNRIRAKIKLIKRKIFEAQIKKTDLSNKKSTSLEIYSEQKGHEDVKQKTRYIRVTHRKILVINRMLK